MTAERATQASQGAQASPLRCPQCGGETALPSGVRILACSFCGGTLFVDRSGLVNHYRLPRMIDREHAIEALNRWMNGNETVKDLDKKSQVTAVVPTTFPLWMFRCQQAQAGQQGRGAELVLVEPAAATTVPQLADLRLPAGKLEPFRPEAGSTDTPATVPLETARGWLGPTAGKTTETALVELPLWECRYRYQEREYLALVEGSTGSVLAAVFPEKAETPFFATAALGLVLFLAEGFLITNPLLKALAYALTAVPLGGMALWVTRKV